jgi:hypothetical protein
VRRTGAEHGLPAARRWWRDSPMSMFENAQYCYRETYFVLFDARKRPTLAKLQKVLCGLNERFTLANLSADEAGRFESLTVLSPDDFAALDISYLAGDEVLEYSTELLSEMATAERKAQERSKLERMRRCDGRFDVLHFEQIVDLDDEGSEGNGSDEMLDPSALLIVLDALVELTGGIAVDPQAGSLL